MSIWDEVEKESTPARASSSQVISVAEPDWRIWQPEPEGAQKGSVADDARAAGEGFLSGINPVSGLKQAILHPIDTFNAAKSEMSRLRTQAKEDFKAGDYAAAAQHGLGGIVPVLGPMASNTIDASLEGDARAAGEGLGQIASLKTTPMLLKGAGKVLRAGAEPIMENALGIRPADRAPAKTPGRAALDMTRGFHPETIRDSAAGVIKSETQARDAVLANSNATVDLQPARDVVTQAMRKAAAGNSDTEHLKPIRRQLARPRPGFSGATIVSPSGMPVIDPIQTPTDAVMIRNRLGNDFTKFDVARPVAGEARKVGNAAYSALTNEIHRAVPESAPFDRNISNLIPVRDSAQALELQPGAGAKVLQRIGRHTGALVGAGIGYEHGGLPGAIAGLVIPELLTEPPVQVAGARAMNAVGGGLISPAVSKAGTVLSTIQPKERGREAKR